MALAPLARAAHGRFGRRHGVDDRAAAGEPSASCGADPTLQAGRETQRLPLADALEKKQEKSRESADSVARDALASRRADTVAQTPAPAAPRS